jgi:protocatechuate 3,4-dioxygenase beta subunit
MRAVHRAAACVVGIAVSVLSSGAQQPSPPRPVAARPDVIINGRVVSADVNGLVLRGARVAVVGGPTVAPVFTDGGGRFSVAVPADYALAISKAGFAPAVVTGRASAPTADLTIPLARGAAIEGQVVDSGGYPVSNARVRVRRVDSSGGGAEFTADTDDAGAYRIGSLPAGRYQLHSERAAVDGISAQPFIDVQLRQLQLHEMKMREEQLRQRGLMAPVRPMSETVTVDLRAGEQSAVTLFHQTDAVLPPDAPIGGFVSGVVSDEFGDPLADVDVRLWLLRYSGDRYVAQPAGLPRRTDDRGRYRMFFVTPGRYILAATIDDARVAPVYYPGVTAAGSAVPLVVGRRQEVSGTAIQFRRTHEARVFGFAVDAAGEALRGTLMLQAQGRSGQVALAPRIVTVNADGTFEFLNVPPGDYVLSGVPAGGGDVMEFASQSVVVDGPEVPPVTIRTGPMAAIAGRIEMEGGGAGSPILFQPVPHPDYPVRPAFYPARLEIAPNADGSFQMRGLAGPVRFTLTGPPRGVWLKAVSIGGVNAVEEPVMFNGPDSSRTDVVVTFASSVGDLSGRVFDERGDRAEDFRVVVFSTTRERWYAGSQFVRIVGGPDVDDGFTVTSLPPGDYFAAAVDGIEGDMNAGDWQNPEVLAALSTRAQRVTVGERQRAAADLRLIRWLR